MFTQSQIILPQTYSLLQNLMQDETLNDFYLVGGTALALQIGHRYSVDLDLFSSNPFQIDIVQQHLQNEYNFETDYIANNILKGVINNVKCDFITHAYALIQPIQKENNIKLASLQDIAAMKLNTIAQNGTRYKDFIDIYYLLEFFLLQQLLETYHIKYPKSNTLIALKGLGYFDDINFLIDTPILIKKISFDAVKKRVLAAIKHPDKIW